MNKNIDTSNGKALNNFAKEIRKEALDEVEKIFDECANKTDIWDNERYDKFRKLFRKGIKELREK